jgi:DNA-binding response OmpR family regulator
MKRILVVEDDTANNRMMVLALEKRGYSCQPAYSGTEALLHLDKSWDAVILDLMLPGLAGETVLEEIKARQDTPVLILTAKDSMDSKLRLLTGGADDYMTKPFNLDEMLARIDILIRRAGSEVRPQILRHKDLILDRQSLEATLKGQPLNLTKSEFHILSLLVQHPKRIFTKQDIYEAVWDDYYVGTDNTINVHISNIRKKMREVTEEEYIETVWGIGFRLHK